jgi:hypothetical protein
VNCQKKESRPSIKSSNQSHHGLVAIMQEQLKQHQLDLSNRYIREKEEHSQIIKYSKEDLNISLDFNQNQNAVLHHEEAYLS